MVLVYGLVALAGGLTSCALLWSYGAAIALLSMPIAGSLLTLAAAVLISIRASTVTGSSKNRGDVHQSAPEVARPVRH